MKRNRLSMSVLFAALIAAGQPVLAQEQAAPAVRTISVTAPDPAVQIRELANLLRANDLAGLVTAMVPPANYQKVRQAYEKERVEPITDSERAEFAEKVARFTAPDAVDALMAEIEPKLAEARPKASGALMMGFGALQVALASDDNSMTAEERASLQAVLPGLQRWATTTDFLSALSARQALTLITDAARRTGVDSIDELKSLPFEQVLGKAGLMFGASKQALKVYGLDVDAIASSLQVQVLAIEGATARVRTTVTVFDAPITSEHDLVLVDGRWYGKGATTAWKIHHELDLKS